MRRSAITLPNSRAGRRPDNDLHVKKRARFGAVVVKKRTRFFRLLRNLDARRTNTTISLPKIHSHLNVFVGLVQSAMAGEPVRVRIKNGNTKKNA